MQVKFMGMKRANRRSPIPRKIKTKDIPECTKSGASSPESLFCLGNLLGYASDVARKSKAMQSPTAVTVARSLPGNEVVFRQKIGANGLFLASTAYKSQFFTNFAQK